MFADRKYKKGIGVYVFAGFILVALITFMVCSNRQDKQNDFLNEHTSTSAVVLDKYISSTRATWVCWIVAEHEAVNRDGEEIAVSKTYSVPVEDYLHIEVGDRIEAVYLDPAGWRYLSFETTSDEMMVCSRCGGMFDTAYCGDCGTPMNPEG